MGGRASSMERKRQSSEYVAERADGGLTEVLWKVVHGCNI